MTARLLGGPVVINSVNTTDGSVRLSVLGKIDLDNSDLVAAEGLGHVHIPGCNICEARRIGGATFN